MERERGRDEEIHVYVVTVLRLFVALIRPSEKIRFLFPVKQFTEL